METCFSFFPLVFFGGLPCMYQQHTFVSAVVTEQQMLPPEVCPAANWATGCRL